MRINIPCYIYADQILHRLIDIVNRHRCDCIALSGGIDTSVILLAAVVAGLKPKGYTTLYMPGLPKDLIYVTYISKALNVDIEYVYISSDEVEELKYKVIECIGRDKIDSHGDGGCIEVRNDIVFYSTLLRARNNGCKCVYVGSGGDELFVGYGFMLKMTENELEKTIDKLIHGRYPEIEIARCIGIDVLAPFTDEVLVGIAKSIPLRCLRSEKMMGKEVLRYILMERDLHIVSERTKTPAESGAGTISICKSVYDY